MQGDATGWHKDVFIQNSPYPTHKKTAKGGDSSMRERCVVTDDWKLILNTHREPELYDRRATESDRDNVFEEHRSGAVVRDLVKRLAAWGRKTDDAMTAELIARWSAVLQAPGRNHEKT